VCAEAIDSSSNLRSLVVRVLYGEFNRHAEEGDSKSSQRQLVVLRTYTASTDDQTKHLPLSLLKSLSVLLSIWKDENAIDEGAAASVKSLVDSLLHPENCEEKATTRGLAFAVELESGTNAVPVEFVCRDMNYVNVISNVETH
jgi:hypothetical protein